MPDNNTITIAGKTIRQNIVDRVVNYFNPAKGMVRLRSRAMMAVANSYLGASTSRRQTARWNPTAQDADTDIVYDLPMLRARSRDLVRNAPIATGALNTETTNVVGTGLRLQSRIDRDIINMSDEDADAWESKTEREWRLFFESKEIDVSRTLNGYGIEALVFRQAFENGDVFINLPRIKRVDMPYSLKLQVIEADRVCNEGNKPNTEELIYGVEKDENGAPKMYHILNQHPGNYLYSNRRSWTWTKIPAFGEKTGLRNVIHLYDVLRPGQTRGVPRLAPVIEPLKQLDKYTEAELMAAVVAACFTVFVKTAAGEGFGIPMEPTDETGGSTTDKDYKLAPGVIIGLAKGEEIETADPKRPNTSFDPFFLAIVRQIGIALEIPYEVLIKHYTASYSAARAALLDAWKHFNTRRSWLVDNFLKILYEVWLYEAVAIGRISAPGFFADPLIRMAYCGSEWVGPAPGQIDPQKEINAAEKRLNLVLTTRAQETAALTGGDFERNIRQVAKEKKMMDDAGIPWGPQKSATAVDEPANVDEDKPENLMEE